MCINLIITYARIHIHTHKHFWKSKIFKINSSEYFQMLLKLLPVLCTALPLVLSQSNYASQGNSIEYQPGLPPSTVLNGKVTKLDDISSMIFLNRTKAYLNCSQGSMQVELKFEEPFHGVAYADFDRNSACIFKGRGSTSAKLELPLKGVYIYIYILFLSFFSPFLLCFFFQQIPRKILAIR